MWYRPRASQMVEMMMTMGAVNASRDILHVYSTVHSHTQMWNKHMGNHIHWIHWLLALYLGLMLSFSHYECICHIIMSKRGRARGRVQQYYIHFVVKNNREKKMRIKVRHFKQHLILLVALLCSRMRYGKLPRIVCACVCVHVQCILYTTCL